MNVIVIGGGIIGLSSAYYLQQRGVDVTVLERGSIGSGSTDRAAGGIRLQFDTPVSIELSKESVRVWECFEATFGVDIQYERPGYLFLARDEETADQLRQSVEVQNKHGVPSEFVSPEEATEHCPGIHTNKFVGGTYSPTDGFVDPHLGLQGFATAVAGANVRTGTEVVDVLRSSDGCRVTGVKTADERLTSDYVVNAAGAWGGQIGKMAGIEIPITPYRRQVIIASPDRPVSGSVPFTFDYGQACYFRPERNGNVLIGGNFGTGSGVVDPDRYSKSMDFEWAAEALERTADCATYFGDDSRVVRGWAGLYAVTPDRHPVIEETVPGFVNAVGFSGHGFMQSPATGITVAELVVDGDPSTVDVSMLRNDRFETSNELHDSHGEIYG